MNASAKVLSQGSSYLTFSQLGSTAASLSISEDRRLDDLEILGKMSNSKFPIFLVFSPKAQKEYAMKVFKYQNERINPGFLQEARFSFLDYPHIISTIEIVEKQATDDLVDTKYYSYILQELALCDFYDLSTLVNFSQDEKLVRTYFHQLICVIEYLHFKGISHLDLKLENLLLSDTYDLKLCDFDLSYMKGDPIIEGKGTEHYRSPEIKAGTCIDPLAADIYSAAIILFILRSGFIPYLENKPVKGLDLYEILLERPGFFWEALEQIREKSHDFSQAFKELFLMMVAKDAKARATLEAIKKSAWYNEAIYSKEKLFEVMSKYLNQKNQ